MDQRARDWEKLSENWDAIRDWKESGTKLLARVYGDEKRLRLNEEFVRLYANRLVLLEEIKARDPSYHAPISYYYDLSVDIENTRRELEWHQEFIRDLRLRIAKGMRRYGPN